MPNASLIRQFSLLLVGFVVVAVSACEQKPDSTSVTPQAESISSAVAPTVSHGTNPAHHAGAGLTLVADENLVCMVNNQYMGKPQIPVSIEGKTYYGCCPMCKDRLATSPSTRAAIDPVSKKPVDKADAVIAKTSSGNVLYFQTAENFAAYATRKNR